MIKQLVIILIAVFLICSVEARKKVLKHSVLSDFTSNVITYGTIKASCAYTFSPYKSGTSLCWKATYSTTNTAIPCAAPRCGWYTGSSQTYFSGPGCTSTLTTGKALVSGNYYLSCEMYNGKDTYTPNDMNTGLNPLA
jgi:hypothetical protein